MSHLGTERTPSGEDEAERGNSCPETEGKSHNLVLFKVNKKISKRRCCCKCEREHGPNEELSIGDLIKGNNITNCVQLFAIRNYLSVIMFFPI